MSADQRCEEFINNLEKMSPAEKLRFMTEQTQHPENGEMHARVQNFYNDFVTCHRECQLWQSGGFDKLCSAMAERLGPQMYPQVMKTLEGLRTIQRAQIKKQAPQQIVHTSCRAPEEMKGILRVFKNVSQFGEDETYILCGNSEHDKEQRLFYSLRTPDPQHKNINWRKSRQDENGNNKTFYILEQINKESYSYYADSKYFEPVVSLGGRFGGEWTAVKDIPYTHAEKNNHQKMLQDSNCEVYLLQPGKKEDFIRLCGLLNNPQTAEVGLKQMTAHGIIRPMQLQSQEKQIISQHSQRE